MSTPPFEPRCADFADRVRDSFARQGAMETLGAELSRISQGVVEIETERARRSVHGDKDSAAGVSGWSTAAPGRLGGCRAAGAAPGQPASPASRIADAGGMLASMTTPATPTPRGRRTPVSVASTWIG